MPASCSANSIAVSAMSTPTGASAQPASRRSAMISLECACIRPKLGGMVPRMPSTPARQADGSSQSQ